MTTFTFIFRTYGSRPSMFIDNINFLPPSCNGVADGTIVIVPQNISGGAGEPFTFNWSNGGNQNVNENLLGGQTYTVTVTDSEGCLGIGNQFLVDPDPITFDFNIEAVNCFGDATGSAEITNIQSNNNAIDTYAWDVATGSQTTPTAGSLAAGTYAVTLTDSNGCTGSNTVDIPENSQINVGFDVLDNPCNGYTDGQITANVTGGVPNSTGNYSFAWSAQSQDFFELQNLAAGWYLVTITDDLGCIRIDSAFVDQPASINPSATSESVTCFGDQNGSITVSTQGGTPPFTYSLDGENFFGSSTLIGLVADDYTVTIQDGNGCLQTVNETVGSPNPFIVNAAVNGVPNLENVLHTMRSSRIAAKNNDPILLEECKASMLEHAAVWDEANSRPTSLKTDINFHGLEFDGGDFHDGYETNVHDANTTLEELLEATGLMVDNGSAPMVHVAVMEVSVGPRYS